MGGLQEIDLVHFSEEIASLAAEIEELLGRMLFPEHLIIQRLNIARHVVHLRTIFESLVIEKANCRVATRKALVILRGTTWRSFAFESHKSYGQLAVFSGGLEVQYNPVKIDEVDFDKVLELQKKLLKIKSTIDEEISDRSKIARPRLAEVRTKHKGGRSQVWNDLRSMILQFWNESNAEIAKRHNDRFKRWIGKKPNRKAADSDEVRKQRNIVKERMSAAALPSSPIH